MTIAVPNTPLEEFADALIVTSPDGTVLHWSRAGCDAYLHKPLSTRTLAETLADVVAAGKQARR